MSSKAILHAMRFDPRVEDAEPEPVEVVVERGDVVDVEVHRGRRGGRRRFLGGGGGAAGSTRMAQAAGDQGRLADLARELTDN